MVTLVINLIGQLSRDVIGRLSVKLWCYWLRRLSNVIGVFRSIFLSHLNCLLLLVKLSVVSHSVVVSFVFLFVSLFPSISLHGAGTPAPYKRFFNCDKKTDRTNNITSLHSQYHHGLTDRRPITSRLNWSVRSITRVKYHQLTWYNSLWRWLSHRLSKRQSPLTTVLNSKLC